MKYGKALVYIAAALVLASCASAPTVPAGPATGTLRLATEAELGKTFGKSFTRNPFLAPSTLIGGKPKDYAVLELKLSLPVASEIEIDADLLGLADNTAELLSVDKLKEYLTAFERANLDDRQREPFINQYCVPGARFKAKAGERTYYVVMACHHPYAPGTRVFARLIIDGAEAASVNEELPALRTKGK